MTDQSSRHTPCAAASSAVHDALGRFTKGNPGGPGNPHHRKVAGLRQALLNIVTPQDVEDIARQLIEVAKEGSLAAIKLFLAYVIGKPGVPDFGDISAWAGDGTMPWLNEAWAKVDAASSGIRQTSAPDRNPGGVSPPEPSECKQPTVPPSVSGRIQNPSHVPPQVDVAVVQTDSAPAVNGGKRLTKKERRALRRQAKGKPSTNGGSAPKVNGDNGWPAVATPAEDPLAALARQRDLLR